MGAAKIEMQDQEPVLEDLSQVPKPGELVRKSREQRGIPPDEFCRQSRLTLNVLRALENDDYARMGEPVYARGYYRKCAEVLGLNAALLIDAYEKRSGTQCPIPTIQQRPSIAYREGPNWLLVLTVTGLICVLLGLASWWLSSQNQEALPLSTPLKSSGANQFDDDAFADAVSDVRPVVPADVELGAAVAANDDAAPAAAPVASATDVQAAPEPQASPALVAVVATAAPAPVPVPTPAPVVRPQVTQAIATPAPRPTTPVAAVAPAPAIALPAADAAAAAKGPLLTLELEGGDSWTEVSDKDGRKLVYKLLKQGSVHQVRGEAPYEIYLGRGDLVRVRLDGRLVDFGSAVQPTLKARFFVLSDGRVEG